MSLLGVLICVLLMTVLIARDAIPDGPRWQNRTLKICETGLWVLFVILITPLLTRLVM